MKLGIMPTSHCKDHLDFARLDAFLDTDCIVEAAAKTISWRY